MKNTVFCCQKMFSQTICLEFNKYWDLVLLQCHVHFQTEIISFRLLILRIFCLHHWIWSWPNQSWVSTFFPNDQNSLKFYRLQETILIWYCIEFQNNIMISCWLLQVSKVQMSLWSSSVYLLMKLNIHLEENWFFKCDTNVMKN